MTSSPGGLTVSGAASPLTVLGLTNGTSYTFNATATNAAGTGSASAASNAVIPMTAPGVPTSPVATAGILSASVAFVAPTITGGSAITAYTVTSTPGSFTGTAATSPITVNGLAAGTVYTFNVVATNAAGTGSASAASNSVTPYTVPDAPTIGTATAGNVQATVAFTAPGSNGSSTITAYTVTSTPGSFTGTAATSPITVNGLTVGTAYTFTVVATNAAGTGSASAASNSVTPYTVPGAPIIGTATAGNAQAIVTFTAPVSNGGSAITSYTVTSTPGSITGTGTTSPLTITGLINGTNYTFKVTATNAAGTGVASAASNSVIALPVPDAPAIGIATAGSTQATVTFTAPVFNGGSTITSYTVTSSPEGKTATGLTSPIIVSGLTNGTAYTFMVSATNGAGAGLVSALSNSVIPKPLLSVIVNGTGYGSVNSNPSGIACISGSSAGCGALFGLPDNYSVTLVATPDDKSIFGGWSGACVGSKDCIVNMATDKNVTITFIAAPKVKVGIKEFTTLQNAYNDSKTISGSVIQMLIGYSGSLTANRDISVTISGGYNAQYGAQSGMTTVQGSVTGQVGTIIFDRVVIW